MADPSRGEVWLAQLSPTRGHEQTGTRPCLIVSTDRLNHGPSGLTFIVPITSKARGIPFHISIAPPEGGLKMQSFAMCEMARSIAKERLIEKWGTVTAATMGEVEYRLRILLEL